MLKFFPVLYLYHCGVRRVNVAVRRDANPKQDHPHLCGHNDCGLDVADECFFSRQYASSLRHRPTDKLFYNNNDNSFKPI